MNLLEDQQVPFVESPLGKRAVAVRPIGRSDELQDLPRLLVYQGVE
jgi:hypothetical protein